MISDYDIGKRLDSPKLQKYSQSTNINNLVR